MGVGFVETSASGAPGRSGRLPEPAAAVGASVRAGRRVREDVRDAAAVAAFSLLTSLGFAVALTLLTRIG